jgi:putative phosphoribosyl transferase
MVYEDRADAGRQLARQLGRFADRPDVIVLGVPRGGVSVAFEVATALRAPLDILLSRKLGVPGQPELAFGAVAAGGGRYLDEDLVRITGISKTQVEQITMEVRQELDRRAALYRGDRPPMGVAGKTVILVDDGMATGASMYAAVQALRGIQPPGLQPVRLVVAVPVAPPATWAWLQKVVDEIVCLDLPDAFLAVGEFYEDFAQVEDAEVIHLLQRAEDALSRNGS